MKTKLLNRLTALQIRVVKALRTVRGGGGYYHSSYISNTSVSFGQMNGWSYAALNDPSVSITANTELCTTRAQVTNTTPNSTDHTLTVTNAEGTFAIGDWALMIQMEDENSTEAIRAEMGMHTLVEVTGVSPLKVKPYVNAPYSNVYHPWVFGTNYIVQIVKIERYWNLTITGGVVTCPKYDHDKGTGGILAIMVGNNFEMTGGFLNVSGKGFASTFTTGQGGAGALAASTYIAGTQQLGGLPAAVNSDDFPQYNVLPGTLFSLQQFGYSKAPLCLINPGSGTEFLASASGENGGVANNTAGTGTINSLTKLRFFKHSDYSLGDLHLGCGLAYTGSSYAGGDGGGGGGKGGNGGDWLIAPLAQGDAGAPGFPGEDGGDAGAGGTGGGIILLKLVNSSLNFGSDTRARFYASGKGGENGDKGGDGGKGGKGGMGADGSCSGGDLVTPGGWGGYGEGGIGGNGADAGDGSCGGTIWILKKQGGSHSSFSSFISNTTGHGGTGGGAGYTFNFVGTPVARNFDPSLATLTCNAGGEFIYCGVEPPCPPKICDCNEVFRHLGEDMTGTVSFTTSGSEWEITKSGQASVFYNNISTDPYLYYTKVTNGCETRYECTMINKALFHEMLKKIFATNDLQTYSGSNIRPGFNTSDYNASNQTILSVSGHNILKYYPALGELVDHDDPIETTVNYYPCAETFGKIIITGGGGSGGGGQQDEQTVLYRGIPLGNDGNSGGGGVGGDFYEDDEVEGIPDLSDKQDHVHHQLHWSEYPVEEEWLLISFNNDQNEVNIKSHSGNTNQLLMISSLYTAGGRLVEEKQTMGPQISYRIDTAGLYFLTVQQGEKYKTYRFLVAGSH